MSALERKPHMKKEVAETHIEAAGKCMRLLESFKDPHDVQVALSLMCIYAAQRFSINPLVLAQVIGNNMRVFTRWDVLEWLVNGIHRYVTRQATPAKLIELDPVFRQRPRAVTLDS